MPIYDINKNQIPCDYLYAVLSRDEDGSEGIVASITPLGPTPMVFGDYKFIEKFKPMLIKTSKDTGRKLYIMKYKKDEQLEVIDCSN